MIRGEGIEHEVVYPHPPERVWRALIDRAELAVWLMPNDFIAEVGRRFTLDATPSMGLISGEVLEVDPPWLLRCQWSGPFGDTIVAFELEPASEGTRLRLSHSGWTDDHDDDRRGFDGGWSDKLSKDLPAVLSGKGSDR
jgi:uncharacterized protein YndB with AHSA1/START domain